MREAAKFIKSLRFEDLDNNTVYKTKDCILDFVGAVLGGTIARAGKIPLTLSGCLTGHGSATLWNNGKTVSCQEAIFMHGTVGSALDFDDGHRKAVGHPGGAIIPAAIAIAEDINCSGKKLLEAIVCGYEVAIRAGNIFRFESTPFVMMPGSGRWGSIGAAAVAAKLLDFDLQQITDSLAVSNTFAPVAPLIDDLDKGIMPMTKFCNGWGGVVGTWSALLAEKGFTGITSKVDFSMSDLPAFGKSYEINNVYFKPYPSCRWTHSALEGLASLMSEHEGVNADTVSKVVVTTFSKAFHLQGPYPETMESAQYNIPFLLGALLVDKRFSPEQLQENRLANSAIRSAASRVEVKFSEELDALFPEKIPAIVTVETLSGSSYRSKVTTPKGDPLNPMDRKDFYDKFKKLAINNVELETALKIRDMIYILNELESVSDFSLLFKR